MSRAINEEEGALLDAYGGTEPMVGQRPAFAFGIISHRPIEMVAAREIQNRKREMRRGILFDVDAPMRIADGVRRRWRGGDAVGHLQMGRGETTDTDVNVLFGFALAAVTRI